MTWLAALSSAEGAAIYTTVATLIAGVIARVKLWPLWREHRAAQQAILDNQQKLLGDRFERPAA